MIKGTLCCNCGIKEATHYWHGGQPLCLDCFNKWDKRDKEVREGLRKELIREKITKKETVEKKSGQTRLF